MKNTRYKLGYLASVILILIGIGGTEKEISVECGWEYRWRVRAIDGAGNPGNWSDWFTFNVPLT